MDRGVVIELTFNSADPSLNATKPTFWKWFEKKKNKPKRSWNGPFLYKYCFGALGIIRLGPDDSKSTLRRA